MAELVSAPVLRRALREQRVALPLAAALAFAWGLVLVAVLATSDPATQRLDSSPAAITSALRLVGLDPLAAWVSIGAVHPFFLALIGVVAIARGVRAVAGELEGGTLALALARPLSRRAYLLAHAAALVPGALLLPAGYVGGALLADRLLDPPGAPLVPGRLALAALEAALLVLALGLLSLLVSAYASERGPALGRAIGGALGLYALYLVAGLWSPLVPLQRVGPFGWFEPGPTIQRGVVPWGDLLAQAAIGAAALLLALRRFERRDLA